jgi:hypothetical protein
MFKEEDMPQEDIIDKAFLDLIHASLGEDLPEEDLDGATDVLLSIIEDLVDADEMTEIPEVEEPEDVKKKWLDDHLEKIKTGFSESVFLEEPHDQDI